MSDSHVENVWKKQEISEEQEQKLSPILEETSEEEESKVSPESDGSNGGREPKVVHASKVEQEQKLSPIQEETGEEESKVSPELEGSNGGREPEVVNASRVAQEQKLSPIQEEDGEEEELKASPEPDDSSGGRQPKVVHASIVEQETKLSPILEEAGEEQEFEISLKPIDSSDEYEPMEVLNPNASSSEQEPMEVLNPDDSNVEPMEVLKHEVPSANQTLIGDANPNQQINTEAPGNQVNSILINVTLAQANLSQAQANHAQAQANLAQAQANLDLISQIRLEDVTLLPSSTEVEVGKADTVTSKGTKEKNVNVTKEIGPSRSIASTSSVKPRESDHICTETCIHGGAKPKTRNLSRLPTNTDAESSNAPDESENILQNLVRLMEKMGTNLSQNPVRNINREEWKKKLENASYLTEEFGRPLGYRPIIQMPEDKSSSPYVVVHRQLDRMFMTLSLNEEKKSETQPCVVTRCALDSAEEASACIQELNISAADDQDKGSTSGSKGPEKVSKANDGENEDVAAVLHKWKIPTNKSEPLQLEKQDPMHMDKAELLRKSEHQGELMEVPEEQILENISEKMEDDGEKDPVQAQRMDDVDEPEENPEPRQEYRLIRLAPILPPINQMGPINPYHPYRERRLDIWRAAMMTAYKSERYHSSELLDNTMSQLEAEGISRDDFYRLYHSTRLIDYYRDDGVDEDRTFSELSDMALEDRINQVIIAVGYMTVAMLYMRLQAERNAALPAASEDSSESSTSDSGNVDSPESEPTVQYVPLREHVNIDLAEYSESAKSTREGNPSSTSCSTTSTNIFCFDIYSPSVTNPSGNIDSPRGIQSPGSIDSPRGIQSPGSIDSPRGIQSPGSIDSPRGIQSPGSIDSPRGIQSPGSIDSPQGIQSPGSIDSPRGIQSPGSVDSPQGILSPDIIVPSNTVESNLDELRSVLIPLREVSKQCETSSSQQSLLNTSDGDSSSPQTPLHTPPQTPSSVKKDDLKRKAILRSCQEFSGEGTSRNATSSISNGHSMLDAPVNQGGGLRIKTFGDLINAMVNSALQQSLLSVSLDRSSSPQTPLQTPPQTPPQTPQSVKKDDLRREAILRSHRLSSSDVAPIPLGGEDALDARVSEGGRLGIRSGDLINMVVGTILTQVKHSPNSRGGYSSTQESCTSQLKTSETSYTQEPKDEDESKSEGASSLTSEVEMKITDGDQGKSRLKKGTEETGGKVETSNESVDETKDDNIHMEDDECKTGRTRKRKEHSDFDEDDEFQLPKRSHTEN